MPAAASSASGRTYGLKRNLAEFDLEVPSGQWVRLRKLGQTDILRLNMIEVLDGFTPDLLAGVNPENPAAQADHSVIRALSDPERSAKIFGPIDRVVNAAVVIPKVSLSEPTSEDGKLVNIDDVDLEDKLAIFDAAFGEQLSALKSVRAEQEDGSRDVPESQSVQPEAQ